MKKIKYFKTNDIVTYLAGAGCGKTENLMQELKNMLTLYAPDEIAVVSFSRKAASEVRNRAELMGMEYTPDSFPYIKTIHALCYMLNNYEEQGKTIINKKDVELFSRVTNLSFNIHERLEGNRVKDAEGQLYFDLYP